MYGQTDGQTNRPTNKRDHHVPHRVNLGSKILKGFFKIMSDINKHNKNTKDGKVIEAQIWHSISINFEK